MTDPAPQPSPRAGAVLFNHLAAMRPTQWTKNLVVLAAYLFAFGDRTQPLAPLAGLKAVAAMLLFCLVSSGIYLLNDLFDLEADRIHPTKRYRPLAAGRITTRAAWWLSGSLLAFALLGAVLVARPLTVVMAAYVGLQGLYTVALKRVALLDIFMISSGFVLRAIAGAVAAEAHISPWLLLCTFLLALFLALCKRRHELLASDDDDAVAQRRSLAAYDDRLLDQLIAITAGSTIVCYAIYTLWPQTVEKFGTQALGFTIPFVAFGIFRYLDLVYRKHKGDRPEKILLGDRPMLATLAAYGIALLVIFAALRGEPGT
jgi:4-hydroxybenzoate polyprenyltransferase